MIVLRFSAKPKNYNSFQRLKIKIEKEIHEIQSSVKKFQFSSENDSIYTTSKPHYSERRLPFDSF